MYPSEVERLRDTAGQDSGHSRDSRSGGFLPTQPVRTRLAIALVRHELPEGGHTRAIPFSHQATNGPITANVSPAFSSTASKRGFRNLVVMRLLVREIRLPALGRPEFQMILNPQQHDILVELGQLRQLRGDANPSLRINLC